MAFGGPRSSCVCPGAHSARHQDSAMTGRRVAWPGLSSPPALTRRTPTKRSALRLRGGHRTPLVAYAPSLSCAPPWSGWSTRERVTPRRPGCPPGLRPLGWSCERGGGLLNGESEDGGRLELWLSLAKRASNSRMRLRRCAMSAVCSATRSRNRLSSSLGFSGEWVRVVYSSIEIDCMCRLLLGKRS